MEIGNYLPLLLLPVMLGWVIWNKMRLNAGKEEHKDKSLQSFSERMGLQIVQGDPKLNLLYFQQPMGDFQRTIELVGRPYGRGVRFVISDGQRTSQLVVARRVTSSFGCRLSLEAPNTPTFEVFLRNPTNSALVPTRDHDALPLHEVRTGNPTLDMLFQVRSDNPNIGPALVPALNLLSTHQYVHLAGGSGQIWMNVERVVLGYVAAAPAEYLLALETAACGLEGRPAPAQMPALVPQTA
ncbi:MAG TPA: hypothetical protein VHM70_10175 [Polyangiaceae bacterium]|nr:hypothetical protein [Polyangiaceae bacterium]